MENHEISWKTLFLRRKRKGRRKKWYSSISVRGIWKFVRVVFIPFEICFFCPLWLWRAFPLSRHWWLFSIRDHSRFVNCFFEKNYEKQAFLYLELRRGWEGTITVMDGSRCMKVNGRDSKTLELRRVDRAVSNLLWWYPNKRKLWMKKTVSLLW